MNHAFVVRVLNGVAHKEKKLQSFADRHLFAIAVLRDGHALDVLHDEVRSALAGGPSIEDPCDIRVVHDRQGLALVGKARKHLARVHPQFDDFEGYGAANGFALLGEVYGAHTPFAERSNDLISAEVVISGRRRCKDGLHSG